MTDATIKPEPTEAERQAAAVEVARKHREGIEKGGHEDRPADHETPAADPVVADPDAPVKPDHVPEKFWDSKTGLVNFEAWSTSHKELETKFHQTSTDEIDDPASADDASADSGETSETPAEQPAHIVNAQTEYAKDGKLSDETYVTLAKQGLDKPTVDAYIKGQEAAAAAQDRMAYDAVEGEENFNAMVKWASEKATPAELEAYNMQVVSDNPEVVTGAIKSMYSRFQAEGEYEGVRVSGDAAVSTTNRYNSKQEYDAAMREPSDTVAHKTKYETDAAYRTSVSKKMAASRKAGIDLFNAASRG